LANKGSFVLQWTGLLIVLCFVTHTRADADLWGHVRFGRDIVRAGAVHSADPYSFTSDIPWVNHEWLAEVVMWAGYGSGGPIGLVVVKVLILSLAGACLLSAWKPFALPLKWRDALLFAVALGAWPQVATFRPQVFSIALFAALLFILNRVYRGERPADVWLLPILFTLWVNLHGGWLVGAGVLVLFVATVMFDRSFTGNRTMLLVASIVAAASTLVNPYGPAMLGFLGDTVRPARADIVEWQPVRELPWVALGFWVIPAALAVAGVVKRGRSIPLPWLVIAVALAVGSFRVARLVGFFSVAVGLLIAPYIYGLPASRGVSAAARDDGREGNTWLAAAAYVAILAVAVLLFGRRIPADAPWLPEPEAATFVQRHQMSGRMLTWFDYGQYAIWHLSPAIRVSMDGRRETVYSEAVRALHWEIYGNGSQALENVRRLSPDSIWLPLASPVISTLERDGWRTVFRGTRSTILTRDMQTAPEISTATVPPRSFPGP
jgi:hypothetical protein